MGRSTCAAYDDWDINLAGEPGTPGGPVGPTGDTGPVGPTGSAGAPGVPGTSVTSVTTSTIATGTPSAMVVSVSDGTAYQFISSWINIDDHSGNSLIAPITLYSGNILTFDTTNPLASHTGSYAAVGIGATVVVTGKPGSVGATGLTGATGATGAVGNTGATPEV